LAAAGKFRALQQRVEDSHALLTLCETLREYTRSKPGSSGA
jgi:hypothetical protein